MNDIIGIKYVSAFSDPGMYGNGSLNCIRALCEHTSTPITIEEFNPKGNQSGGYGEMESWRHLIEKPIDYNVKIIHTSPTNYPDFIEPGVINIGFLYWETDRIPEYWGKMINRHLDAQFVCCRHTQEALLNSNVDIPVSVIPPGFEFNHTPGAAETSVFGFDSRNYRFYSIAQWTERKNIIGLLKAYLTEFTKQDRVLLVLKTYLRDHSPEQFGRIKQAIDVVKMSIHRNSRYKDYFPPIALINRFLNPEEMRSLHEEGDCFVLPHRGEGLGFAHAEAMAIGNPVIATALGANTEFMNKDNSFLIPYFLTPVMGMPWIEHYECHMNWAEPNIYEVKRAMRFVYENQERAKYVGRLARETIHSKFSSKTLARRLVKSIKKVLPQSAST